MTPAVHIDASFLVEILAANGNYLVVFVDLNLQQVETRGDQRRGCRASDTGRFRVFVGERIVLGLGGLALIGQYELSSKKTVEATGIAGEF
jgi:hypothetical protein